MANTNAATSFNAKWFQTNLQETLKKALVCEKICNVDRSGSFYIWSPYGSAVTATTQSISGGSQGTYSISTYTSTADTLTVTEEVVASEHIYDFEIAMQHGNILRSRQDEIIYAVAYAVDKWVLNNLCEDGTGTYDTPAGGFTQDNSNTILANLVSKVAGYQNRYGNLFLVVEQSDLPGIVLAGAASGFTVADSYLKNGWVGQSPMGVDIYVVQNGTFVDATIGSTTVTNSGHRVFGVKGITTYASPTRISWVEKGVSGKTGYECVAVTYVGFRAWYATKSLIVDITIK